MEAAKTKSEKPDLSLAATALFTSCGVWVGGEAAELCTFFMKFPGAEKAISAACMLVFGTIGLVFGFWVDSKFKVKL